MDLCVEQFFSGKVAIIKTKSYYDFGASRA